ncbi:MAG: restriction endonuclease subunit S [Polyangia bacterium]
MTHEWEEVTLASLMDVKHGFAFSGEHIRDVPPGDILLTPGNFAIGGGFKEDKFKYFNGEVPSGYILNEGDLIVTMTDLSKQSDTLGYPAVVPCAPGLRFLHNQRLGKVIIKDRRRLDKYYLFYLLRTAEYRHEVLASATGTTVKHTSPGRILAHKACLPPLAEQIAIASTLSSLDDKIELNRRMNTTLEAMARALFQSWFVDFEPVRVKSGKFRKSPIGEIPEGWELCPVRTVVEALFDGPHATPSEAPSGNIYLGIKNFTKTQLDLSELRFISNEDWPQWTRRVTPRGGDIVFTYEATLGYFAIIPDWLTCCLGRRTALIRPVLKDNNRHYLFHYFTASPFQEFLRAHTQPGSTVDRILLKDFPDYPVLIPPKAMVERFDSFAAPIWARIHALVAESRTLASLRDTLLPKLLSGELRVRDAEKFL